MSMPLTRYVETVLVPAGEWVTITHNLNCSHLSVSVYLMSAGEPLGVTITHMNRNAFEFTTSYYTYLEPDDGPGALVWSGASRDELVRVVVHG